MGWYYQDSSRKTLINQLTKEYKNGTMVRKCIKHCYRGNPGRGVLWSVWNLIDENSGKVVDEWIGCDIMQYNSGQWGYKPLSESMHPYYYSCPLSYFKLVPRGNDEWRKLVLDRYRTRRQSKEKPCPAQ